MARLDTRSALLAVLGSGTEPTQEELAHRLGVTVRTVRRHLADLAKQGAITARRDGLVKRFHLVPGARPLPPLPIRLTEAEAEALTVAALAARAILAPTPFAGPLSAAAESLERAWIAEAFSFEPEAEPAVWDFEGPDGPSVPFDPAVFRALLTAVREHIPLEAAYYTALRRALTTERRLHPLGFFHRAGSWLVAAYCCRDGRVKDFALAGFREVRLVEGERFDAPPCFDLHGHARDRFRAVAGDDVFVVRLEVAPEAAPYFERKAYHPTQQVEAERPDGSTVVSFEVEGLDDVAAFVLSWGPKVQVLEPPDLVERIARALRTAAARYV